MHRQLVQLGQLEGREKKQKKEEKKRKKQKKGEKTTKKAAVSRCASPKGPGLAAGTDTASRSSVIPPPPSPNFGLGGAVPTPDTHPPGEARSRRAEVLAPHHEGGEGCDGGGGRDGAWLPPALLAWQSPPHIKTPPSEPTPLLEPPLAALRLPGPPQKSLQWVPEVPKGLGQHPKVSWGGTQNVTLVPSSPGRATVAARPCAVIWFGFLVFNSPPSRGGLGAKFGRGGGGKAGARVKCQGGGRAEKNKK